MGTASQYGCCITGIASWRAHCIASQTLHRSVGIALQHGHCIVSQAPRHGHCIVAQALHCSTGTAARALQRAMGIASLHKEHSAAWALRHSVGVAWQCKRRIAAQALPGSVGIAARHGHGITAWAPCGKRCILVRAAYCGTGIALQCGQRSAAVPGLPCKARRCKHGPGPQFPPAGAGYCPEQNHLRCRSSVVPSFTLTGFLSVKLNGGRHVQGILRGFDPFMNLVIDECVEMAPGGQQNNIGMVVIRGNSIIMLEALERV
nr:PREDICTED: small nuclear ribonucleoprotein G [Struthio camelus australis]